MLIGDDQNAIAEMEKLVYQNIGCTVAHPSKYYRPQGHHQATFNSLPLQVCGCPSQSLLQALCLFATTASWINLLGSGAVI